MRSAKSPPPHYKKKQLSDTLTRLESCLKAMVEEELTYKNKSRLSDEIGQRLDLDASIFRKADGEHRKLLNRYLHVLLSTTQIVIPDAQAEIKALRSQVAEKDQKIKILKQIISEQPQIQPTPSPQKGMDNFYYEYETTCMLVWEILKKNQNLKFIENKLYDEATFSGDPEIISENKNTDAYLRWVHDRVNSKKCLEQFDLE